MTDDQISQANKIEKSLCHGLQQAVDQLAVNDTAMQMKNMPLAYWKTRRVMPIANFLVHLIRTHQAQCLAIEEEQPHG